MKSIETKELIKAMEDLEKEKGNSDSLTWGHCIGEDGKNMCGSLINSDGTKKEIYKRMKQRYMVQPMTAVSVLARSR